MKKIFIFFCIISFFACNNSIRETDIRLQEVKSLQLDKYEGNSFLKGELQITFQNLSDSTVKLLDMGEHNIVFESIEDNKKRYVPIHSCRAVGFFMNQSILYVSLEAQEIKSINLNVWACDGGSFDLPPQGKYNVYFRTFNDNTFIRKKESIKEIYRSGMSVYEITDKARELFNSEKFWEGAVYSNPILIEL